MSQQQSLFNLDAPMGTLPVGAHFTYDGWGAGTITHNDGYTHRATIHFGGHQVATMEALNPGVAVEVMA